MLLRLHATKKLKQLTVINGKLTAHQGPHKKEKSGLMALRCTNYQVRRVGGREVRQWQTTPRQLINNYQPCDQTPGNTSTQMCVRK